jgi:hypothetical protein
MSDSMFPAVVRSALGDRRPDRRRSIRARSTLPPRAPVCPNIVYLGRYRQRRSTDTQSRFVLPPRYLPPVSALLAGGSRPQRRSTPGRSRFVFSWPWKSYDLDARGLFRVFNSPEYRFYRSPHGPPSESATPFATSSALPHTPTTTFANGTWYLSVSYFNGVIDSGFLPIGPAGETCLTLTIADGSSAADPPAGPIDWRLEARSGGVVRVIGIYFIESGSRADQWAIAYTTDGTTPAADDPDLTEDLTEDGLALLTYGLPAAADGATVSVRLQTRRNDGTEETPVWVYSANSTVLTISADAAGPAAPPAIETHPGPLPVPNP